MGFYLYIIEFVWDNCIDFYSFKMKQNKPGFKCETEEWKQNYWSLLFISDL